MKFNFKIQQYQTDAVDAVVRVFKGQGFHDKVSFIRDLGMLTKLRQGVGRLVRSETDTGVVTILDPRADYRTYGKKIAQALHYYPRVNSVEEISSFIKSVKSEDYFNNTNRRIG